ncbi:MAG: hypothetical protein D6816_02400 [Bacteroidetes bacterium]|nr:MAG: hypothetical protein D6816_02400 [Bacteroidota bacterium]
MSDKPRFEKIVSKCDKCGGDLVWDWQFFEIRKRKENQGPPHWLVHTTTGTPSCPAKPEPVKTTAKKKAKKKKK